jgi:hypothetical protein
MRVSKNDIPAKIDVPGLFYWPPGHSVRVVYDADVILFSPQHEHGQVMDHMLNAMKG